MRWPAPHEALHIVLRVLPPAILVTILVTILASCGSSLPKPPAAPVSASDYVAVPFSPRPPPVEYLPPPPTKSAVWMDGSWEWVGDRYVWRFGSWVVPPEGARRARWVLVRRAVDGQLFFAPSSWKDSAGNTIDDRAWVYALGPRARARARPGAPAPLTSDPDTLPPPALPEEDREDAEE